MLCMTGWAGICLAGYWWQVYVCACVIVGGGVLRVIWLVWVLRVCVFVCDCVSKNECVVVGVEIRYYYEDSTD